MAAYIPLVRYKFNEATTGMTPTQVVDEINGVNLPITYNSNANWTSEPSGAGLQFTAGASSSSGALVLLNGLAGTAIASTLSGATEASAFGVFRATSVDDGSNIFHLGRDDGLGGAFRLAWTGTAGTGLNARWNNDDGAGATYFDMPGAENVADGDLHTFVVIFDPASTGSSNLQLYIDGNLIPVGYDEFPSGALPTFGANHFLAIANRLGNGYGFPGGVFYFEMGTGVITPSQVATIHSELLSNNDQNPLGTPTLNWVAEPAFDQVTSSGGRLQLTTNLPATVKLIMSSAGSSQPSSGAFDAVSSIGTTTAFTVFQYNLTGQSPSTSVRGWVQITNGVSTLYDYADLTTLAVSNTILSVNGGQPIREGQTGVVVLREAGATGTTETTWNGVVQANHTVISDTESRFDVVWPNLRYGFTGTININGETATSPALIPPTGSAYITAGSGYSASTPGAITAFPDAVPGDQLGYQTQSGAVSIDDLWRPTFTTAFNGDLVCWIIDAADGTRSSNATIEYLPPADIIPDQFDLGADATNQDPGTYVVRSFTVAGVDAATNITFTATGSAQVSNNNSTWLSSVTQQLGGTVYVRVATPNFGQPANTGGVYSSGISDSFSVSVRAPSVPTITAQPTPQSVTSGVTATFTITATNAVSYQWRRNGVNISGANSSTYSRVTTDADIGTASISCVVTSAEGGSVTSNAVDLTVIAAATRITIPIGVVTARGVPLAGTTITANIYSVVSGKCGGLVYTTPVTLSESGPTYIDNNQNGSIGTQRFLGIPSTIDNSEALFLVTVT